VVLRSRRSNGTLELEVSDSGTGFAPDFADSAFERFTRGDRARGRDGTGLGLSIVRTIAKAHGGGASVVPGDRATVRIWLPNAG
jgi:two-component system, OmpR family, sensor kinase